MRCNTIWQAKCMHKSLAECLLHIVAHCCMLLHNDGLKSLGGTVDTLASEGLLGVLQAWEDDLLINHATGEILGKLGLVRIIIQRALLKR